MRSDSIVEPPPLLDEDDGIEVRWYDTQGEQFHTKLLAFRTTSGTTLIGGSASLTRRNLGDYNLEADLLVRASDGLGVQASDYFERRRAVLGRVCGLRG
jgi:HKD family nuclease